VAADAKNAHRAQTARRIPLESAETGENWRNFRGNIHLASAKWALNRREPPDFRAVAVDLRRRDAILKPCEKPLSRAANWRGVPVFARRTGCRFRVNLPRYPHNRAGVTRRFFAAKPVFQ